jgi:Predicted pyridoxal phosphate-dependent enzyme apparently involved in regulation of cell wall biogenesis
LGVIAEYVITIYPNDTIIGNSKRSYFFKALGNLTKTRIIPFSSARAAMVYGLRALGFARMDEVLVPSYLSHCIISALARTSFPTMTSSCRTKGILVYHQFGFPQRIKDIAAQAAKCGWIVLNDCANTMFSSYNGELIMKWGDFSVLSFSKIYPCTLGGALISSRSEVHEAIDANYETLSVEHTNKVIEACIILKRAKENIMCMDTAFEIDAVFGYLSELVTFPDDSLFSLPKNTCEIEKDVSRRKQLLSLVRSYFPDRIPDCQECDVVPFAIPVSGESGKLESISYRIKQEMEVDVPVLHFDFARNMLDPNYKKSLVIGCHEAWSEELIIKICEIIKLGVRE